MGESSLPRAARSLLSLLSVAFTAPTFKRVLVLLVGAVLCTGRHTVCSCLWAARAVAGGDPSDYHRVFSRAPWPLWPLGRVLAAAVVALVPPGEVVVAAADDTVAQHRGDRVYGKGMHRDAVRSSDKHTVWKFGHKWVVLAVNVTFPFCSRPWSLPVLCALYRDKEADAAEGRRHKTPAQLARQLMAALLRMCPDRRFVLLGDGGFASHDLARFCRRHRDRVTLVSLLPADANLYAAAPPPPPKRGRGPLPRKGPKLPSPEQTVAHSPIREARVPWYGGQTRRVGLVSCTGHWYRSGAGLVHLRWVFVRDLEGKHRDHYLYCTDPSLAPERVVALYTGRWCIEVTFEEVRCHLGFETTRQWSRPSVLRAAPCLLGLFSVVSLVYAEAVRLRGGKAHARQTPWYAKAEPTFSDAIREVRRLLWSQTILKRPGAAGAFRELPRRLRELLLGYLADTT